ncbi:MAG: D-alanyl-D-alanine carboxypeptidase [Thermodesulfobacteriota bacterium]
MKIAAKTKRAGHFLLRCCAGVFVLLSLGLMAGLAHAGGSWDRVRALLGKDDSAFIQVQGQSGPLWSLSPDTPRIPASTLKVFTCLASRSVLGPDFRFSTEFLRSKKDGALIMKGFGDPLLISEVLRDIARKLVDDQLDGGVLVLDGSYFSPELSVPGAGSSANPYDSQPGALCVNFNSIEFTYGKGKKILSTEPQTPMTDFARNLIRKKRLPSGRALLTGRGDESTLYAGHLLSALVAEQGGKPFSQIRVGRATAEDQKLFVFESPFSLDQVMEKLLCYSNNFMTNQLFLTAGAKASGPPATLAKSTALARSFAEKELGFTHFTMVEGSGISRQNKITAREMDRVLEAFFPLRGLLPEKNGVLVKTGTLSGISARAGYVQAGDLFYRVTVLCNTPGRSAEKALNAIARTLQER